MPVYNGEKYIDFAIKSILHQTYAHFEFIIINDGSTDKTQEILEQYQKLDSRIKIFSQLNLGISASLNRGIELSNGKYIARADCDDISAPERLIKQVRVLEEHPEIGIVGCNYLFIDRCGRIFGRSRMPATDLEIRWENLFNSPFAHPAVMMQKKVLSDYKLIYRDIFLVEDYDLWSRFLCVSEGANLIEPLLMYRYHPDSISEQNLVFQVANSSSISLDNITNEIGIDDIPLEDIQSLRVNLIYGTRNSPELLRNRIRYVKLFLSIWDNFYNKYSTYPTIEIVRERMLVKVFRLVLFPLFQNGWHHILWMIIKQNQSYWLKCFLLSIFEGIDNRVIHLKAKNYKYFFSQLE